MIDDGGVASGSWGPGGVPCPAAILFGSTPASQPQILKLGDNKSDANISLIGCFGARLPDRSPKPLEDDGVKSLESIPGKRPKKRGQKC